MTDAPQAEERRDASTARRQAFVTAARAAFFAQGYGGTTMSSIASAVGGSKTTLWTYFPSKEELFAAVVDDIVEQYGAPLSVELPLDEDVETVLTRFAEVLMATLVASPMLNLHRLVAGESSRFPHLAELFYDRGPRRGKARLATYFEALMSRGILRKGDPALAVSQFVGLCHSPRYQLAMLGLEDRFVDIPPERELAAAVRTFYCYWGKPSC